MFQLLNQIIKKEKSFNIQTFTCFIPSPPERSSLYREKHFDHILCTILKSGFEVVSIHTTECSSPKQSGIWVLALLRPLNENANSMDLNKFLDNHLNRESNIEGIYYLNDNKDDLESF